MTGKLLLAYTCSMCGAHVHTGTNRMVSEVACQLLRHGCMWQPPSDGMCMTCMLRWPDALHGCWLLGQVSTLIMLRSMQLGCSCYQVQAQAAACVGGTLHRRVWNESKRLHSIRVRCSGAIDGCGQHDDDEQKL